MAPLDFTEREFECIRHQAETFYFGLDKIRCPYLEEEVHFNTEGFRHLLFKQWNRGRDRYDQFMRLKYLSLAPDILRLSHTVQGIQETHAWERRHRHGKWEKFIVDVTYYEFVAVIKGRRFKVIVKRLFGSEPIFWSLVPFWRQSNEGKRLVHNGTPADD